MIALVTGATGFVGQALARRLLSDGHRVVALVRDGVPPLSCEVVRGELEDTRACERAVVETQPDVVFHLAAQAIVGHARRDPFATLESNVRGTYNLLEACRRHPRSGTRIVVASSDKAYGEAPLSAEGYPRAYFESDPLRPDGPYDVSKACADLIAQSYALTYGMRIGVVRAGNIYGARDPDRTRIVPTILDDLANSRRPVIRSDGTPVRDYIYIDDAVRAYLSVDEHLRTSEGLGFIGDRPPVFNFSGGSPIAVVDLVRLMMRIAGVEGDPIITAERTGDIRTQILGTERARSVLGWAPTYSLHAGLLATMVDAGIVSAL